LDNITTFEWNEEHDGGRLIAEGERILIAQHPKWEKEIRTYYERWHEMLGGPIQKTVDILTEINLMSEYRLFGLTNWSAETFPVALERYAFLQYFEGIVVSGQEQMKKPDPKIYQLILDRYSIVPEETIFIDDNKRNIDAALKMGIDAIHFTSADNLLDQLKERNIRVQL